jgi:hypothetical protein
MRMWCGVVRRGRRSRRARRQQQQEADSAHRGPSFRVSAAAPRYSSGPRPQQTEERRKQNSSGGRRTTSHATRAPFLPHSKKQQGTASTLTRSDVRGGGKKPYKQKGTGNARRGSNTSPLFPGGGITFGPKVGLTWSGVAAFCGPGGIICTCRSTKTAVPTPARPAAPPSPSTPAAQGLEH